MQLCYAKDINLHTYWTYESKVLCSKEAEEQLKMMLKGKVWQDTEKLKK